MARRSPLQPLDAFLIGLVAAPRTIGATVLGFPLSSIPVVAGAAYGARSSAADAVLGAAAAAAGVVASSGLYLRGYVWAALGLGVALGAQLLVGVVERLAPIYAMLAVLAILPVGALIASALMYILTAVALSIVTRAAYELGKLVASGAYSATSGPVRGFVALLVSAYTIGVFLIPGLVLYALTLQYILIAMVLSSLIPFLGAAGPVMAGLGLVLGVLSDMTWIRWLRGEANEAYYAVAAALVTSLMGRLLGFADYLEAAAVAALSSLMANPPRRFERGLAAASSAVALMFGAGL